MKWATFIPLSVQIIKYKTMNSPTQNKNQKVNVELKQVEYWKSKIFKYYLNIKMNFLNLKKI
jgi:hypothetical protein